MRHTLGQCGRGTRQKYGAGEGQDKQGLYGEDRGGGGWMGGWGAEEWSNLLSVEIITTMTKSNFQFLSASTSRSQSMTGKSGRELTQKLKKKP